MHRSSESVAALATALAKAQLELVNPEKSLVATLPTDRHGEPGQSFRYASLSSGLDIVRKTLGRHEIAFIQTTAVDQTTRTVQLTTLLAHTSGEWIASEWPVCPVTDTSAPRRMGAALTYARRYALFTLVGIAGEDDLDAPDLNGGVHQNQTSSAEVSAPSGTTAPPAAGRRRGVGQGSGCNGKAATDVRRTVLAAEPSAALRDQLLTEIASLASAEDAATWARRVLEAKNRLTAGDAKLVEDTFAVRSATFEEPQDEETPPPSAPTAVNRTAADSSPPKGIDKSALTFGEPRRHRDKTHLRHVAQQACLVCGRKPSDPHHLRFSQPHALGRKVSDEFTVPLCRGHHRAAHHSGDEPAWWRQIGIDPMKVARKLWRQTRLTATKPRRNPLGQPMARLHLPRASGAANGTASHRDGR